MTARNARLLAITMMSTLFAASHSTADEIGSGFEDCLRLCESASGDLSSPEQSSMDLWQQLLEWFDIDLAEDE